MIKKISHIAVIVPELDEAMGFWVDALGLKLEHVEHVEDQGVDVAFLPAGESDIELLEPIDSESGVARFLERKGPGMHHICFEVDDIDATLARLKEKNVPLINEEATIGTGGKKIAFIHIFVMFIGVLLLIWFSINIGMMIRRTQYKYSNTIKAAYPFNDFPLVVKGFYARFNLLLDHFHPFQGTDILLII